jgi:hypothetical protein
MMKSLLKRVLFGSTTLGILATSFSALADIPHPNAYDEGNVWWLDAYYDDSSNHQLAEYRVICFGPWSEVGTQVEYKWWRDVVWPPSPHFDLLFIGRARQEGDQIFMVGDGYNGDRGWHDSRQWEMTSLRRGYGHLQRWNEASGEHAWYNIELTRFRWRCDCDRLASDLSTVAADINIDNADTFEKLLSTQPACSSDEAESAPPEEVAK